MGEGDELMAQSAEFLAVVKAVADAVGVEELRDMLEEIEGQEATATATIDADAEEAGDVLTALDAVDGSEAEALVTIDGSEAVETLDDVTHQLDEADGRTADASVNVDTTEGIGNLQRLGAQGEETGQMLGAEMFTAAGGAQTFMQAVQSAGKALDGTGIAGEKAMKGISAAGAGTAAAIAGVVLAAKNSSEAFLGTAEAARQLSLSTGTTTEEMSRWIAVADDFNVNSKQMGVGMLSVTKAMQGSGEAFVKYGIDVRDANGELRSSSDVLLDVMQVLSEIDDPTQRAATGIELLGRGYRTLAPMVGATKEEMEGYLAAVEDGQVITAKEAQSAEDMRRAQDQLADAINEVKIAVGQLIADLAPLIVALAEGVSACMEIIGPLLEVAGRILDVGRKADEAVPSIREMSRSMIEMGRDAGEGKALFDGFGEGIGKLRGEAEPTTESLNEMAQAMLDDGAAAGEVEAALKETGATTEMVNAAMEANGLATESAAEAAVKLAEQTQQAKEAQAELVEQLNAEVEALTASAAAAEERSTAMRAAADANFALTDSQVKFNETIAGMGDAWEEAAGDALKQQQVLDDVAQSAGDVADAQVRLAEETALAAGETWDSTQALDTWNRTMLDMARSSTPMAQQAILDFVFAVNQVPESKETAIRAAVEAGSMTEAKRLLDEVSTNRDMTVTAKMDTTEAALSADQLRMLQEATPVELIALVDDAQAKGQLDTLKAGPHETTVKADADTSTASKKITDVETDDYMATIDAKGATDPAKQAIEKVADDEYMATVDSDAKTAKAADILLDFISQPRVAEILALVVGIPAVMQTLAGITRQQDVPIHAYLSSYPTASQIARTIGTVRVPVDAYTRSMPRVSGSR